MDFASSMEFDYPSYEIGYRRESRCQVQQKISFRAPEKCPKKPGGWWRRYAESE